MDLKFKVNDRVRHKKFGRGTITMILPDSDAVTVKFDNEYDGKSVRTLVCTVLELDNEEINNNDDKSGKKEVVKKSEDKTIKIGDLVEHKEYGLGIVIERKGFFKHVVKFKTSDESVIVFNKDIVKVEIDIIDDDELVNEDANTKFRVIPSNYSEHSSYSASAKRLLTYLNKKYDKGVVTLKAYKESEGEHGVLIVPDKGIIVFKLMTSNLPIESLSSPAFDAIFNSHYEILKEYYYNKFLQAKTLCEYIDDKEKVLKYPVRFVVILQDMDISKMTQAERTKIVSKNKNIFFKNFFTHIIDNDLFSEFEPYDSKFDVIPESVYGSIIERVVPENATLIDIAPTENKSDVVSKRENPKFEPITGEEREFSALYLDDSQIKTINDTKPGHYLTLANPGTGKSVLLISKAYRLQSIQKDNHVLVTCYNKNLAEHHSIFAEVSGMKTPRLHIRTFHRLAIELLRKVEPYFVEQHNPDVDDNNFDILIDRLGVLVDAGKIHTNFNAIFIDEVQLFEPKWIDICFKLLDKEDGKDYFFEMYGDINQDVKSQRSKGKASWQNTTVVPSLQGRVRKLDKNYRNTDMIANYLRCMIGDFNEYLNDHGFFVDIDSSCLSSDTIRKGVLRTKILLASNNDVSKVSKTVNELVNKLGADYSDIAVVYPAKKFGEYYTPIWKIEKDFEENNIPFSFIHGDAFTGSEKRRKIFECDGVIMSTIDSCLGLDFKYVILCGVHYWDFMYDESAKQILKLNKFTVYKNPEAKYYLSEVGKKIYSACSRAREGLYIIDDLDLDSPIKAFLRPKSGREYFDEN